MRSGNALPNLVTPVPRPKTANRHNSHKKRVNNKNPAPPEDPANPPVAALRQNPGKGPLPNGKPGMRANHPDSPPKGKPGMRANNPVPPPQPKPGMTSKNPGPPPQPKPGMRANNPGPPPHAKPNVPPPEPHSKPGMRTSNNDVPQPQPHAKPGMRTSNMPPPKPNAKPGLRFLGKDLPPPDPNAKPSMRAPAGKDLPPPKPHAKPGMRELRNDLPPHGARPKNRASRRNSQEADQDGRSNARASKQTQSGTNARQDMPTNHVPSQAKHMRSSSQNSMPLVPKSPVNHRNSDIPPPNPIPNMNNRQDMGNDYLIEEKSQDNRGKSKRKSQKEQDSK